MNQTNAITDALDKMVQQMRRDCDHYFQDRVTVPGVGVWCGRCGERFEN